MEQDPRGAFLLGNYFVYLIKKIIKVKVNILKICIL